jgi:hypothetical protein
MLFDFVIGVIVIIVLAGGFAALKMRNEKDRTGGSD